MNNFRSLRLIDVAILYRLNVVKFCVQRGSKPKKDYMKLLLTGVDSKYYDYTENLVFEEIPYNGKNDDDLAETLYETYNL